MSASTRLRRANKHVVGGNAENQSGLTKAINRVNRRRSSVLDAPKRALTDVTNSFKSPPRDPSARQEANLTDSQMKKPIATPIRASSRISSAKANQEKPTQSANETVIEEGTGFKSTCQEAETTDPMQAPKTTGRRKPTAKSNDRDSPQVEDEVQSKSAGTSEGEVEEPKTDTQEQDSRGSKRQTKGKQVSKPSLKNQRKTSGSDQTTKQQKNGNSKSTLASKSKPDSKDQEDQSTPSCTEDEIDTPVTQVDSSNRRRSARIKKAEIAKAQTEPSPVEEADQESAVQEKAHHQQKKVKENEASSTPEQTPSSSSASSETNVRKSARQAKLKSQNQLLSLETDKSDTAQQELGKANQGKGKSDPPKSAEFHAKRKTRQTKIDALMSSPKYRNSAKSSPKPSPVCKSSETKKVPIYKLEPKPEAPQSPKVDVYDFEYDPKDVKPKRKRVLKPIKTVRRTKKPRVEPENLPPIELKLPGEEKLGSTSKADDPRPEAAAVIEVESPEEAPASFMDQSIPGPLIGELPASTPISASTPCVNDLPSMASDPVTPIAETGLEVQRERTPEPAVSTAALEQEPTESETVAQKQAKSNPTLPPLNLGIIDCFGFDDAEDESNVQPAAVLKSTPVKRPHHSSNAPFRPSVSPVRKALESKRKTSTASRPARLELSRDVIGIHPIGAPQEKKKQTTLPEFIQEVGTIDRSTDEPRKFYCPPTPPTVFTEPPRRSYSKQEMRKVKRTMFKDHIDVEKDDLESAEENDENADSNPSKPKKVASKKPRKTKQEKKADEWAKEMAKHFEDVDKSKLIVSE